MYICIYVYIHAQVIQNCTTLSRVDIYNKDGKQHNLKQRKQNKCRGSQPSPVSSNPGCWTIHLASACNCPL